MFDFLKKKDESSFNEQDLILNVACLLIHAAKIDEDYTKKESILCFSLLEWVKIVPISYAAI